MYARKIMFHIIFRAYTQSLLVCFLADGNVHFPAFAARNFRAATQSCAFQGDVAAKVGVLYNCGGDVAVCRLMGAL